MRARQLSLSENETITMGNKHKKPIDPDYLPSNRDKARVSTKAVFYCICDRAMVGDVGRCHVCGKINNPKKIKGY